MARFRSMKATPIVDGKKLCGKCNKWKSLDEFVHHKRRDGKVYVESPCKECHQRRADEWRRANRTKDAGYSRKWRALHPETSKDVSIANYYRRKEKISISLRMKKYGLNETTFQRMMTEQKNRCPICDADISDDPCVDHCHVTNRVRGILCRKCNSGMGHLGDSPERLRRAIQYLENQAF